MTISSMAGNLSMTYAVYNKASFQKNYVSEASYAKSHYNVTDMSEALSNFTTKNPTDNLFTDTSSQTSDKVDLNGITGDLLSYSKNSYLASKLGLVIGPVNLYSVHRPTQFAKNAYSTYTFNTKMSKLAAIASATSQATAPTGSTLNAKA